MAIESPFRAISLPRKCTHFDNHIYLSLWVTMGTLPTPLMVLQQPNQTTMITNHWDNTIPDSLHFFASWKRNCQFEHSHGKQFWQSCSCPNTCPILSPSSAANWRQHPAPPTASNNFQSKFCVSKFASSPASSVIFACISCLRFTLLCVDSKEKCADRKSCSQNTVCCCRPTIRQWTIHVESSLTTVEAFT